MSLNRIALALLVLIPTLASAEEIKCPDAQAGTHLSTVTLFDGPPDEHADLMPDTFKKEKTGGGKSDWDVAYIFEAGRQLYVECQYGSKVPSIVLKAPKVNTCTFKSDRNSKNSLTCK
ncbi:hypothetical protein GCM10011611_26510 [Aliidongia dinghuensis]|uniref:Uncharacterized protein n=1 Tax=Aliidongia dinghuensis TaxID=1867774 RepID=A0A8J3E3J9_9PROT|nr:hypothetical protein GCM10011611_26510 [Aliidongia dinghuensis]